MSRAERHYLGTRFRLCRYWHHHQLVFGAFTLNDQWALHDYYRFTDDLTDSEALLHRRIITILEPSLRQRAGKRVAKLDRLAAKLVLIRVRQPTLGKHRAGTTRTLVLPIAKPEMTLDSWVKIAVAFVEYHLRHGESPEPPPIPHDDTAA